MAKRKSVQYINMGPWPAYVGYTDDEGALKRELKRLGIADYSPFIPRKRAIACAYILESVHTGAICSIIAIDAATMESGTPEQQAGLVAHEALHIIQSLRNELNRGEQFGDEAESYMLQHIVQEVLQGVWGSSKCRRTVPA